MVQDRPLVCFEVEWERWLTLQFLPLSTPYAQSYPQNGEMGRIGEGQDFKFELGVSKRWQIKHSNCIGRHWRVISDAAVQHFTTFSPLLATILYLL